MITLMVIRVTVINDCLLPHARHYARHFTHISVHLHNGSCLILVPLPLNCQMQFIKTCLVLKRIWGFLFYTKPGYLILLAVNRTEPQKDEIQSENFKLMS